VTIDEGLARHLHVESLRHRDLHPEHEPHVLFQASTIGALLEGAFDGDVSLEELAGHGDLGLGTLNGLDGEMIAIDGRFYRADVDGRDRAEPLDHTAEFDGSHGPGCLHGAVVGLGVGARPPGAEMAGLRRA
jgi:acetolactate decarboxylase